MNDWERILDIASFQYEQVGYVDLHQTSRMTGIPEMIVENVLTQNRFLESGVEGQFIRR